jgi:uncharacterized protein (TIGR04222 family)
MNLDDITLIVNYALAASCVLLIVWRVASRERHPRVAKAWPADVYEASFLAGGPGRVADTALAAMQADGRLAIAEPGIASVVIPVANDPVEQAVLDEAAAAPNGALGALRHAVMRSATVQAIGDRLAGRGLLRPPGQRKRRAAQIAGGVHSTLCLIAFIPAAVVTGISYEDDWDVSGPFILQIGPLLIAGVLVGAAVAAVDRRRTTPAGRRALRGHTSRHSRSGSVAHRVAVKGPRGVRDRSVQALLVTAAAVAMVAVAGTGTGTEAAAAADHDDTEQKQEGNSWCGAAGGGGCGNNGGDGGSGGGDGCGGGCGGCGGCGG